jgi:hypothetical protein
MPMAYAAQMGGVCTLIGTSSNLLTDTLAQKHGLAPIGVFEFTKLGALLALAGITYLLLIGRWLLPQKVDAQLPVERDIGKYVAELRVGRDSPVRDRTIEEIGMGEKFGVHALQLLRGEEESWSPRTEKLQVGDVLLVRGEWDKLEEFRKKQELEINPEYTHDDGTDKAKVLVEAMIRACWSRSWSRRPAAPRAAPCPTSTCNGCTTPTCSPSTAAATSCAAP